MGIIIKQLIIVLGIFILFVFIQDIFVKNYKEKASQREMGLYDKYKFPLLVSAIVGLILNLNLENGLDFFPTIEVKIGTSMEPNMDANMEPSMDANMDANIKPNIKPGMEPCMEPNINASINASMEPSMGPNNLLIKPQDINILTPDNELNIYTNIANF